MEECATNDKELIKSFRFQNREILDEYVIIVITDPKGIINHVSTSMCNRFKYRYSDLICKPYELLIKTDFLKTFQNQFNDVLISKSTWKGEIKHSSSIDDTIWTDTIIKPLYSEEKVHLGFILTSSDITKEKKLKKLNEENILTTKHKRSHLEFMPSLTSAVLLKTSNTFHKVLWMISFTIMFLFFWSYISKIDDIVKSEGKVINTTNTITISSLNGGVLNEIYHKEGDMVKKGDILFKLSDIDYKTDFEKSRINKFSILGKIQRLKAQAENKAIKINQEVLNFDKTIMENEIILFNTNEKKFNASKSVLEEQLQQRKNELDNAYKNMKIFERSYELLKKEMAIKIPLVEERVISKVEILKLQRIQNDTESELKKIKGTIPIIKSSIKEINKSIVENTENYRSSSQDDLMIAYNEIKQVNEDFKYLEQRIQNTNITAPNDGTINKISIKTKGEAISPGKVMAEITPGNDFLLAEVKISPENIGFLYIGQSVRLKLRPYDFSLYGAIDAKISYISSNTLVDEQDDNKEKYIIYIKAKQIYLDNNKKLKIKPGMTIDADIITGKRSILSFILKPIRKSLDI